MAITKCPVCRKRISSRAASCPYCHEDVTGDDQELAARQRSQYRKKTNSLKMQLALAMTLLVICIGLMLLETSQGKSPPSPWYIGISLAASGWYVATRLRIFFANR